MLGIGIGAPEALRAYYGGEIRKYREHLCPGAEDKLGACAVPCGPGG
ncbi:hypothetical protein MMOR_10110 [Mycolicibacterium moriokaense]|uniref:Uncharacterized protein n=1 Tax=Mycolicibacterium moriokaense TaxID=39691 RepID=A0AAD1M5A1_9MYCO|nr:hypothetical protein MMOR_10110 [Mycolicibacterium moriokaense]